MQDFMQDLTFEEVLEATMRLEPELRHVLVQLLHVTPSEAGNEDSVLQSEILSEAGAYSVFTPLCDVHPHGVDATDAELLAAVQCLSCEWEEEAV
jgi:hypothetical protein